MTMHVRLQETAPVLGVRFMFLPDELSYFQITSQWSPRCAALSPYQHSNDLHQHQFTVQLSKTSPNGLNVPLYMLTHLSMF
jgi:hypothetical protein